MSVAAFEHILACCSLGFCYSVFIASSSIALHIYTYKCPSVCVCVYIYTHTYANMYIYVPELPLFANRIKRIRIELRNYDLYLEKYLGHSLFLN